MGPLGGGGCYRSGTVATLTANGGDAVEQILVGY
jgi:hypothetical protein